MKDTAKVTIKNRSNMMVVYSLPELGIRREFSPNETKTVDFREVQALSYKPGGLALLQNSLVLGSKIAMRAIGLKVEPEYYFTEADVIELLNNGSLDEFLDCLDFAPLGVKDLIKKYAYELPVNDSRKRKAIKEKLDFDVELALLHKEQVELAQAEERGGILDSGAKDVSPTRRVKTETANTSGRRVTPAYKVISRQEG